MFGALDKYYQEGYLKNHAAGSLLTKDGEKYSMQLFAVLSTDASDETVFSPDRVEREKVLRHFEKHSVYFDGEAARMDGSVLALSTCRYPDTTERTVIAGMLSKDPSLKKGCSLPT